MPQTKHFTVTGAGPMFREDDDSTPVGSPHKPAGNLPPRREEENWRSSLHVENNRAQKKHKPKGQSLCGTRISENSQF